MHFDTFNHILSKFVSIIYTMTHNIKALLFFLLIFIFCNMAVSAQEIIAHRGASYIAPENTLASVKLGYELNADAVEVDVHLSADNRIMVIHDADSKHTGGNPGKVIRETNSEELRKFDVGSWKNAEYQGEKIPFIEEVLEIVPEGKLLVIELKSSSEIVPYLREVLIKSGMQKQLILISFDKEAIIKAKSLMPNIPAYWLLHNYKKYNLTQAIEIAKTNNLQGLDVYFKLVDEDFMKKMKAADLEVYVYTVNDPKVAKELSKLKVKGITTDRPDFLRDRLTK